QASATRDFSHAWRKDPATGETTPKLYPVGSRHLQRAQYAVLTHPQRAAVLVIDLDHPTGCREDKSPRSSPGPHPARPPRGRWLRPLLGGREPADREGAGALADRSRLRGEGPPQLEHGPVGGGDAPASSRAPTSSAGAR